MTVHHLDGCTQLTLPYGGQAAGIRRSNGAAKTNGANGKTVPALHADHESRHVAVTAAKALAPTYPTAGRMLAAVILGMAGVGLAGVGACATINFALDSAGTLMAALATGADTIALVTPTCGCVLWHKRQWLAALTAWLMWAAASSVTLANIAGFVGEHGDQFFGQRETASVQRSLVLDHITALRRERSAITEARPVGVIVQAIRNATAAKVNDERAALAAAKARDALDAELTALEPKLAGLPVTSTIDPSAAILADVFRLPSQLDLRRIRVGVLVILPLSAGLLLGLAFAVGTGTTPERKRA